MEQFECGIAEKLKRAFCYLRRHERMAVAVPANPGSERETRDISCLAKFLQWKSRIAPRFREVKIKAVQGCGE